MASAVAAVAVLTVGAATTPAVTVSTVRLGIDLMRPRLARWGTRTGCRGVWIRSSGSELTGADGSHLGQPTENQPAQIAREPADERRQHRKQDQSDQNRGAFGHGGQR
ncbi:hypothetical protein GCM10010304_04160 [Streptomyces roseoviolaceus]